MHSCMLQYAWRAEDIDTRFKRARVASSPEVPKGHVMKNRDISRLPFTLAKFA